MSIVVSRAHIRVDSVLGASTRSAINPRGLVLAPPQRMDSLTPQEMIDEVRQVAIRKASLPAAQMLLRGALAGGILANA